MHGGSFEFSMAGGPIKFEFRAPQAPIPSKKIADFSKSQSVIWVNIIKTELQDYVGTDITPETFVIRSIPGIQKCVVH